MSIRDKYVFVTTRNEDMQCVGIKEGPFAGVVYKYGKVGFAPESEKVGEMLPMKFDYTVIENRIDADTDSQEFIDHIGDILVVLIDDHLKEKKELDGKN